MKISRVLFLLFAISAVAVFAQEADLAVEKIGPAEAPPNSDVSYDVTITNVGPDEATFVSLDDLVPAGMSYVSATQNNGPTFTCDTSVACSIAALPAGDSASFTFVFHMDSGTEFINTATVSSETPDPNDENDQSTAITTTGPPPQADLFLQKDAPAGAAPDTDIAFEITLGNAGPSAAVDVLLTDNLPGGLTFVSFVQNNGPPMACGPSTCTIASFPANATATFTLTGHVPPGTPGGTTYTNTATVESENDPLDENNTATTTVTVSSADVSIVKDGPANAVAGTTITYTITVVNNGPDPALNVVVSDPALCESQNCTLGTLLMGVPVEFTFDVDIPSGATSWSNTATVTTDSIDTNGSNDSSTVVTAITQSADLEIVKSGPGTVVAGTNVTYSVTVTNNGPSDASNVSVIESLPAGTTFVSSTCGSTTCNFPTLTADASTNLTFVLHVDVDATGPIVNTVTVASSTADPNGNNNESSATTAVTPAPIGLTISKTADPQQALIGSEATYTIVVTNNGPGTAMNVVVTDELPAGTTLVSAPGNCTGTTTITCNVGTLTAGNSSTIDLVVTLPSTPGTVSNTASVEPGGAESTAAITVFAATPGIPTLSFLGLVVFALALALIVVLKT